MAPRSQFSRLGFPEQWSLPIAEWSGRVDDLGVLQVVSLQEALHRMTRLPSVRCRADEELDDLDRRLRDCKL